MARSPTQQGSSEEPIVVSPTEARGAVISGRVITVLVVSLLLALFAMALLLSHFYSFPFAPILR